MIIDNFSNYTDIIEVLPRNISLLENKKAYYKIEDGVKKKNIEKLFKISIISKIVRDFSNRLKLLLQKVFSLSLKCMCVVR